MSKPILILMGPTASGKTAIGTFMAQQLGGMVINADAMQCYADLRIITARPNEAEMQDVPHQLYGIWTAKTKGNAGLWLQGAIPEIEQAHKVGKIPILVGGTGLYVRGLHEGLANLPEISSAVKGWIDSLRHEPGTMLYQMLKEKDPMMAKELAPNDSQRILRALEVMQETGKSLKLWQQEQQTGYYQRKQCHYFYVDIPRDIVTQRIDRRFEQMVAKGVVDEVKQLKEQFTADEQLQLEYLDYPILKAHGVPEILAYLDGEMTLDQAIAIAQRNTRRYAKRQMTWIRGQTPDAIPIPYNAFKEMGERLAQQEHLRLYANG